MMVANGYAAVYKPKMYAMNFINIGFFILKIHLGNSYQERIDLE